MSIKFFLVALVASSLTAYAAPIAADSAIEKRGYHGTVSLQQNIKPS